MTRANTIAAMPAQAQTYTTQPTMPFQPQFGWTTTAPNGDTWVTKPRIPLQPQFGYETTCQVCSTPPVPMQREIPVGNEWRR